MDTGNSKDYGQAGLDYYLKVVFRKISNFFLSYPEFMFMGQIFLGILALVIIFLIFRALIHPKSVSVPLY
jgi:hypothetical protein